MLEHSLSTHLVLIGLYFVSLPAADIEFMIFCSITFRAFR